MDVSSVKAKATADASASTKPKSTAEQLMGDFSAAVAERMKKTGQGVTERNQNSMMGKLSAKSNVAHEPKQEPAPEKAQPRDDHQPRERAEAPEPTNDHRERPAEAKEAAPRENPQNDKPQADGSQDARADDAPKQDNAKSNGDQKSGDDAQQKQADGDNGEQKSDVGDVASQNATDGNAENQGETVLAAVTEVVTQNAGTQNTGVEQQAQKSVSKTETVKPGQQANANIADGGEETPDMLMNGEGAKKKAAANAAGQQTQMNQGQRTENTHVSGQDQSLKQQQAQDLSSKLGNDQKVEVKVNVTRQSEQLVSQPNSTLSAQAATKTDGESLTQTATQTAAKAPAQTQQAPATHNLGNQSGQPGQEGQQQAQQNLQQAALAEAAKNAANSNKAQASQSAANTTAAVTAKTGGTEGLGNPQGVSQNHSLQQQQQTAAAQKPQHNPQAHHRAQVTEQVNVQIQKAIQGGMDKINIQLKPAHLGRIEISMEMSADGRVTTTITADNKDTLDLLKQDSRELQKAMREAGLDMNSGDMNFNLREGSGGEGEQQNAKNADGGLGPLTNEPPLDELLDPSVSQPNVISDDRVDITA